MKDISSLGTQSSEPRRFTVVGNTLFFFADDGVHGRELWKTDGTPEGTVLVKDFYPGATGFPLSATPAITAVGSTLFFVADDGVHGKELWRSDGTPEGTVLLKDIQPGPAASAVDGPSALTAVGDTLFFHADDGVHGRELWKSNGTPEGTLLVRDIFPGAPGSMAPGLSSFGVGPDETLYFNARDGVHGSEPWKSDGTPEGTVLLRDLVAGNQSSSAKFFVESEGTLYFAAETGSSGDELWKSDGTPEGTVLVKDTRPPNLYTGFLGSYIEGISPGGNGLVFFDVSTEYLIPPYQYWRFRTLWRSDGSSEGTFHLREAGGAEFQSFGQRAWVNGALYFAAQKGEQRGLWKYDGTQSGAVLLREVAPTDSVLHVWGGGGTLFFALVGPSSGVEVWQSDGSPSGNRFLLSLGGLGKQQDRIAATLTWMDGALYFAAAGPAMGDELWRSDGTEEGTRLVRDINARSGVSSSNPSELTDVDGVLYFRAQDGTHGEELWVSLGTPESTSLVRDLRPGAWGSTPDQLTNLNGMLTFTADDGVHGRELWRSTGSAEGTVLVRDLAPGLASSSPRELTSANGTLFFVADDGVHGVELWKSDGTDEGTALVRDIWPGAQSSSPRDLRNVGGTLFFVASDGVHGAVLWKSDGTAEGTSLVRDSEGRATGGSLSSLTPSGGQLFFVADWRTSGRELVRSDGTAAGTFMVRDFWDFKPQVYAPKSYISVPLWLTDVNGVLFLVAWSNTRGLVLWKSDGTPEGTVIVKDVTSGDTFEAPNAPQQLTGVGGTLYFAVWASFYDKQGLTLWKSDGTAAGTVSLSTLCSQNCSTALETEGLKGVLYLSQGDELWMSAGGRSTTKRLKGLAPEATFSAPRQLRSSGDRLFFTAEEASTGRELWVLHPAELRDSCQSP